LLLLVGVEEVDLRLVLLLVAVVLVDF